MMDCPNLLRCYGAFFEEGSVRLVLEYMDCGSMETMLSVLNQVAPNMVPRVPEKVMSRILF